MQIKIRCIVWKGSERTIKLVENQDDLKVILNQIEIKHYIYVLDGEKTDWNWDFDFENRKLQEINVLKYFVLN